MNSPMITPLRKRIVAMAALVLLGAGCAAPAGQQASSMADTQRGGELYGNVCGACHNTQPHWREKRLVHSWSDLVYQVDRWQRAAGQNWGADDIRDVAQYLNERFYHVPCPEKGCTGLEAAVRLPR
jgi:mono/diheme cytochrome c family protein